MYEADTLSPNPTGQCNGGNVAGLSYNNFRKFYTRPVPPSYSPSIDQYHIQLFTIQLLQLSFVPKCDLLMRDKKCFFYCFHVKIHEMDHSLPRARGCTINNFNTPCREKVFTPKKRGSARASGPRQSSPYQTRKIKTDSPLVDSGTGYTSS